MASSDRNSGFSGFTYLVLYCIFLFIPLGAWFTHVLRCINTEAWLFLIAGAIAVPIGIIHGFGIWIGVF